MRFFQRSIKYFLSLCLAYVVVLYALSFTEMMVLTRGQTFQAVFSTHRGLVMVIAIVALSAAYPYFGFMKRRLKGDITKERDIIIKAFELQHFRVMNIEEGFRITFVAEGLLKRLSMLFEDHILVTQMGEEFEIRGNRKGVAYVVFRLEAALARERELEAERLQKVKASVEEQEKGEAASV
ncbi:MAG: hypothetical protein SNG14_03765 [Rikenellaceae bacterium]